MFFKKKKAQEDYIIVVGCGRLGASLATLLSESDNSVCIIDLDEKSFRKLSPSYSGLSIEDDATDVEALEKVNIDTAQVVVATTSDDNVNIMVAQIARKIYNVSTVIARVYDGSRIKVYDDLGINTICPSLLSVNEFERLIKEGSEEE